MEVMERTCTEEVSTLEGRSVLEEFIPTVSLGWNTTQAEVLSVYRKLCFFLLVLHGLKHPSVRAEPPAVWAPFPMQLGCARARARLASKFKALQ